MPRRAAAAIVGTRTDLKKGLPGMTDTALSALAAAWITAIIANSLFLAALAVSRVWDSAVYFKGLQQVLNLDF
jgi:hypothetical protein